MNKLKFLLIVLFVFGIYSQSFSQKHKVHIAFMGNSITIGSGLPNALEECYPAQIQKMLTEIYGDTCEVQNFAVSGRTLLKHGDFPLWDEPQFNQSWNYAPEIVFIMLGTNDTKPYNWDDYGYEFENDYQSMIDTFKVKNPFCNFIVCYPPPAYEVVYDIRDSVIVNGVIPVVDNIITENNALLVDFYTPLIDSVVLFPDKIHPNAAGAKVMAQIVVDEIVKSDIVHQVETGFTYITEVSTKDKNIPNGGETLLQWSCRNSDSTLVDGNVVESQGEMSFFVALDQEVVIEAYGAKSNDLVRFKPNVYEPVLGKMYKKSSSNKIEIGEEVEINLTFKDQFFKLIEDVEFDVKWEFIEGDGQITVESYNKILFKGTQEGKIIMRASVGDVSVDATIRVVTKTSIDSREEGLLKVYPNPVQGTLKIAGINCNDLNYIVTNANGRTVKNGLILNSMIDRFQNCE